MKRRVFSSLKKVIDLKIVDFSIPDQDYMVEKVNVF